MGKADRNAEERQRAAAQADGKEPMNKAARGVKRAVEQAERGELISRNGKRMNPKSVANLKPGKNLAERSPEDARNIQAMGGTAAGESNRKRKTIREICETVLAMDLKDRGAVSDEDAQNMVQEIEESTGKKVSLYEAIVCAQAMAALKGNTKAAAFVRDSVGDKPVDQVQVSEAVTDGDRSLMAKLEARLQHKDKKPGA